MRKIYFFTDKELQEVDEVIEQISNDIQLENMRAREIFPTNLAPVLLAQDDIYNQFEGERVWPLPSIEAFTSCLSSRRR